MPSTRKYRHAIRGRQNFPYAGTSYGYGMQSPMFGGMSGGFGGMSGGFGGPSVVGSGWGLPPQLQALFANQIRPYGGQSYGGFGGGFGGYGGGFGGYGGGFPQQAISSPMVGYGTQNLGTYAGFPGQNFGATIGGATLGGATMGGGFTSGVSYGGYGGYSAAAPTSGMSYGGYTSAPSAPTSVSYGGYSSTPVSYTAPAPVSYAPSGGSSYGASGYAQPTTSYSTTQAYGYSEASAPSSTKLYEDESWYANLEGPEQSFRGVLESASREESGVLMRVSFYKLNGRNLYTQAQRNATLDNLIGQRVEIVGKIYDAEIEGTYIKEIWPGSVRPN